VLPNRSGKTRGLKYYLGGYILCVPIIPQQLAAVPAYVWSTEILICCGIGRSYSMYPLHCHLGQIFVPPMTPIWDPDLGPPIWTPFFTSDCTPILYPQYGPPIWTPNMDQYCNGRLQNFDGHLQNFDGHLQDAGYAQICAILKHVVPL
jgi:hypothetical protein